MVCGTVRAHQATDECIEITMNLAGYCYCNAWRGWGIKMSEDKS